jgi:hypothetical protein
MRLVARELRLLFLQLYKSETSAVRPDPHLVRLAIHRPDGQIELAKPAEAAPPHLPTLDSIPDMPSPVPTLFSTPEMSPEPPSRTSTSLVDSLLPAVSAPTVLGKRSSEDREEKIGGDERHRSVGRDVEMPSEFAANGMDGSALDYGDVEMEDAEEINGTIEMDRAFSPPVTGVSDMEIRSSPVIATTSISPSNLPSTPTPKVPPPLPPRPMDDESLGLEFGRSSPRAALTFRSAARCS